MGSDELQLYDWERCNVRIIGGPRELIARYVARRQGIFPLWLSYEGCALVNDDDEILAGAVFHGYVQNLNIIMEVAGEHFTPLFMAAICDYAFRKNNCKRITGFIDVGNAKSIQWAEDFGAVREGCMREASTRGDVYIYGLLRADAAKWLTPRMLRRLDQERIPA